MTPNTRKRGRPVGQFQKHVDQLFEFLSEAAEGKHPSLINQHFCDKLGVSERQVKRYFDALRKQGKIEIRVQRVGQLDPQSGKIVMFWASVVVIKKASALQTPDSGVASN